MDRAWPVFAVIACVILALFLVYRYVERAIAQRRPGWVSDDDERGICCPHAVGEKGALGEPGIPERKDDEVQG